MKQQIIELSDRFYPEILEIRRHLHQHPELSFKEVKTAAFIRQVLKNWNLNTRTVADTGLLVDIEGAKAGPVVVLRADIDALPIDEQTNLAFKSANPGVMHACGHDMHTASLLGVLRILIELKHLIRGRIRILFQPGEELLPGGAKKVLESGILDEYPPDYMVAQHVYPELPAGSMGFRSGQYMASTDEIYIEVTGTGGHGGMPHKLIDPVLIASHLVVNLQQTVSRKAPPEIPTVLSFGKFDAPGATNVIPEKVWLEGTFRTLDEKWRALAHDEIRHSARGIIEAMGGKADVRIVSGFPSLINDKKLNNIAEELAEQYSGIDSVVNLPIRMTGEDFARYSLIYPSVYYRWGTGFSDRDNFPVHHPRFEANELALKTGMGYMAFLALALSGREK
ncbi:MAG: amidohydrolase [Bacteroidetes bacterium]|nr:amidohydrolase [Bacteroidota bacterium]